MDVYKTVLVSTMQAIDIHDIAGTANPQNQQLYINHSRIIVESLGIPLFNQGIGISEWHPYRTASNIHALC